jgi:DNA repair protein RecO (recombination protein O)
MRLLARDDPHPALFDAYGAVVRVLASEGDELLHTALRAFELLLLREIGLLPQLDTQTLTLEALCDDTRYCLVPEGGLRQAHDDDRAALSGTHWVSLQAALDDPAPFAATLRACAPCSAGLRPQLRTLLNYHCGTGTLRTRQMMIDLQNL